MNTIYPFLVETIIQMVMEACVLMCFELEKQKEKYRQQSPNIRMASNNSIEKAKPKAQIQMLFNLLSSGGIIGGSDCWEKVTGVLDFAPSKD